jgi:hypothetical protein
MTSPEHALSPRVPSTIEIVGIIAGAIPFAVSMASSRVEWEEGQITSFVYRDPVAIGGGIVAVICGVLAAATLIRRTEPAKKALRTVLCLGLVGLGVFQVLRGFGVAGIDKPDKPATTSVPVSPTPVAPPPTAEPVDEVGARTAVKQLASLWSANKVGELFELSQPSARNFDVFDLQVVYDTITGGFGTLKSTGTLEVKGENGVIHVTGPARFEKDELVVKVTLVREGETLLWRGLTFDIPPALRKEAVPADADALARKAVDSLLANKFEKHLYHPRLVDRMNADVEQQLTGLLAKLGTIKKVGQPVEKKCDEARCLVYDIVGSRGTATFDVALEYYVRAWRVISWNITPNEK